MPKSSHNIFAIVFFYPAFLNLMCLFWHFIPSVEGKIKYLVRPNLDQMKELKINNLYSFIHSKVESLRNCELGSYLVDETFR